MAAYMLGAVDVRDPGGYAAYQQAAAAALASFSVEFLAIDPTPVVLEGEQPAAHVFIVRFASMAVARAFYDSEAYVRARSLRHAAADTIHLMILRGVDDPC